MPKWFIWCVNIGVSTPLWPPLYKYWHTAILSADICISCGSLNVSREHPLFAGGMCQSCKVSCESHEKNPQLISNDSLHTTKDKNIWCDIIIFFVFLFTELLPRMCISIWWWWLPVILHYLLRRTGGAHVRKQQLLSVRILLYCVIVVIEYKLYSIQNVLAV